MLQDNGLKNPSTMKSATSFFYLSVSIFPPLLSSLLFFWWVNMSECMLTVLFSSSFFLLGRLSSCRVQFNLFWEVYRKMECVRTSQVFRVSQKYGISIAILQSELCVRFFLSCCSAFVTCVYFLLTLRK